jgi:ubiquinone/menaquinone biosynthesis C-methylase UbiE
MSQTTEVQRLRTVYSNYRRSAEIQRRWSPRNPGNRAIKNERQRAIQHLLAQHHWLPLTNRAILDIGCGNGEVLAEMMLFGAQPEHLFGVDLMQHLLVDAKRKRPTLHFQQSNAEQLCFRDESMDLVLLFTVISSILDDPTAQRLAGEVCRVLKPGAAVLWYDMRYPNPRNANIRKVTRNALQHLFPNFTLTLRTVTVAPPIARRLGFTTHIAYPALATIPLIHTHYLGLLRKPAR